MSSSAGEIVPIVFDPVRTMAYTSITSSFQAVGSSFSFPARIVKVGNTTNGDLEISFDGTNAQDRIPANSYAVYDMSSAHAAPGFSAMQEQISVYVREISGGPSLTTGYFYCTVIRGKD